MHDKTIATMIFHDRSDFTINDKKFSGDRNQQATILLQKKKERPQCAVAASNGSKGNLTCKKCHFVSLKFLYKCLQFI